MTPLARRPSVRVGSGRRRGLGLGLGLVGLWEGPSARSRESPLYKQSSSASFDHPIHSNLPPHTSLSSPLSLLSSSLSVRRNNAGSQASVLSAAVRRSSQLYPGILTTGNRLTNGVFSELRKEFSTRLCNLFTRAILFRLP